MVVDSKSYNTMVKGYVDGQSWLNDIQVEIEEGENDIDPIVLLRAYEADVSVDNNLALASQFIMNRHVVFKKGEKQLLAFTYTGGDLGIKFRTAPYLLDVLLKTCYGLMLKKLTPPSDDSETEERQ